MKIVKKLVFSIVSLVCVIVCFVASTYAWFDINVKTEVSGFNFQVMGGEGFLVSVDGINFKNSLTKEDLFKAIYHKLDSNTIFEADGLYEVEYEAPIEPENQNPSQTVPVIKSKRLLSKDEIATKINRIKLYPLTSMDGMTFRNYYGNSYNLNSNANEFRYAEFDIYFKATSDKVSDNFSYDIFILDEITTDPVTGQTIEPTRISSNVADIKMPNEEIDPKLWTWRGEAAYTSGGFGYIKVGSANAMRLSVQEAKYDVGEEKYIPSTITTIYELTDNADLGSYATNYDKATDTTELTQEVKDHYDNLYNSSKNFMFNYYNELRPYSKLHALSFDERPTTIRLYDDGVEAPLLTNVVSGSKANLLTFRLWQEGWDADCFDGLAEAINVRLSFTSKKVK